MRVTASRRDRRLGQLDDVQVLADAEQRVRFARIVVQDNGSGISAADLPHIFDRFKTAAGGGPRGTGLGLALVQAVARGHGGEVQVASAPGDGCRFELLLPAMPLLAAAQQVGQESA